MVKVQLKNNPVFDAYPTEDGKTAVIIDGKAKILTQAEYEGQYVPLPQQG
ncbi:MAG: hypothetical protein M0Q92_15775 [Methanoregula sp.]|jgi:hypothetical protein|nr:hypothetical protein [Methanoregula sp.]